MRRTHTYQRLQPLGLLAMALLVIANIVGCGSSVEKPAPQAETYPNAGLLVSGASLAGNLTGANQVIIDVRSSTDYAIGHINGAINLPVPFGGGLFDVGGNGAGASDLKPVPEIAAILGAAGVSRDSRIIVYGKGMDATAGRMFWMLQYLGATDVRILDGGFDKWTGDGRATSTTAATPTATTFTPAVAPSVFASKEDVYAHYEDTDRYAIVDSRFTPDFDTDHIPNALNVLTADFVSADGTTRSYPELKSMLSAKGVVPGTEVIAHCYIGYMSALEYFYFRLMGYTVSNYDGSWAEWAADPSLPKASHGALLATGSWLAANLTASNQVIVDVRAGTDYTSGHIPGAINLPVTFGGGLFDTGGGGVDASDLKPIPDIAAILGAAGVSDTTRIVVYGQAVDMLAGRMFWMLEYIGASKVRLLDGGYDRWVGDGRAVSTNVPALAPVAFRAIEVPSRLAMKGDVFAHYTETGNYAIVDSRNATDFQTKHIPNALNILVGDFLKTDGTLKSHEELKTFLESRGITRGMTVITHCYVGYRSAQHYFVFRLMGFDVSNYDGSWAEWVADPTMPTIPE
jgi:3-mercaptopyruvate sulfurtransferase SseA